ncbi:MAG: hypothetical protein EP338_13120 [Bacteroidetes bacterium]|nr:MAG: hypothetical protein EP338_13120 [Bacteroidota bacterium]
MQIKSIIFSGVVLVLSFLGYGQEDHWMVSAVGETVSEILDVKTDDQGYTYACGYFSGELQLQGQEISSNGPFGDVLLLKIDPKGKYEWVKTLGGTGNDRAIQIELDKDGNLIVVGTYQTAVDFEGNILNSVGDSRDLFILEMDSQGKVLWARSEGGVGDDDVSGLAIDQEGNILLTGRYRGKTLFGGQEYTSAVNPETGEDSYDMYLMKLNPAGQVLWSRTGGGEYRDRGLSVAVNKLNQVFVSGEMSDTIVFFGGTINNAQKNIGFLSKVTPTGSLMWMKRFVGAQVLCSDIVCTEDNEVVMTGDFKGTLTIWDGSNYVSTPDNSYDNKIFTCKIGADGALKWFDSKGSQSELKGKSIAVDAQEGIYVTGTFKCNFDEFRAMTSTAFWQSAGFWDIYTCHYSSNGQLEWYWQSGGSGNEISYGITVNNNGRPILGASVDEEFVFAFKKGEFSQTSNYPDEVYGFVSAQSTVADYGGSGLGGVTRMMVANMISERSTDYTIYQYPRSYKDSVRPFFTPNVDTARLCPDQYVNWYSGTMTDGGPQYDLKYYYNGQTGEFPIQYKTGTYVVEYERKDRCFSSGDTIYVIRYPRPPLPLLSDNIGVNIKEPKYKDVEVCYDTLQFWFQDICVGCTLGVKSTSIDQIGVLENDTLTESVNSIIHVNVADSIGCMNSSYFAYKRVSSIKPYLIFADPDLNDSIQLCDKGLVIALVADSISNPTGEWYSHVENVLSSSVKVFYQNQEVPASTDGYDLEFSVEQDGWYYVNEYLTVGSSQCPQSYVIVDSIFCEIKRPPELEISPGGELCPGDSMYIVTTVVADTFVWYGPSISWVSENRDSILVNGPGSYSIVASYNFEEISCTAMGVRNVTVKTTPKVLMDPEDGLICPGDSVKLYLDRIGNSYLWLDLSGDSISKNEITYVQDQGFYACLFEDEDGCLLLTSQVEVKKYATPFLELTPKDFICRGETAEISVIFVGDAGIQWHAPIESQESKIEVDKAGWYAATVQQCGFSVTDSVELIDGSFEVELLVNQENPLCYGDSIRIEADVSAEFYEWNVIGELNKVFYAKEPGAYFVKCWNSYGCLEISDTVYIEAHDQSWPPEIGSVTICPGEYATLIHDGTRNVEWYYSDSDLGFFSTQDTIILGPINKDSSVYASYSYDQCPRYYTQVLIDVLEPIEEPSIIGDSLICTNLPYLTLETEEGKDRKYRWVLSGDTIGDQRILQYGPLGGLNDSVFSVFVWDKCSSNQASIVLNLRSEDQIEIANYIDTLCLGESFRNYITINENLDHFWYDGNQLWVADSLIIPFDEVNEIVQVYNINEYGCISDTLTVTIKKADSISLVPFIEGLGCEQNEIKLQVENELNPLVWTKPDNSQSEGAELVIFPLHKSDEGMYQVSFVDTLNCVHNDSLYLEVYLNPNFELGNDTIVCANDLYSLTLPFDIETDWVFWWNQGDSAQYIVPDGQGIITLSALNEFGCIFSDSIRVELVDCQGEAANVVTPNGDGINEHITVFNAEYMSNNHIRVYNRWGNLMFEQSNYQNNFSPREWSDGVYFYEFHSGQDGRRKVGYFHLIKSK